jgi:hypothetical protein
MNIIMEQMRNFNKEMETLKRNQDSRTEISTVSEMKYSLAMLMNR